MKMEEIGPTGGVRSSSGLPPVRSATALTDLEGTPVHAPMAHGKFGKFLCWRPPPGLVPPPTGNPGSAPALAVVRTVTCR